MNSVLLSMELLALKEQLFLSSPDSSSLARHALGNVSAAWVCLMLGFPKVLVSFTKSDAILTYSLEVGLKQENPFPGGRAMRSLRSKCLDTDWFALFWRGEHMASLYPFGYFSP